MSMPDAGIDAAREALHPPPEATDLELGWAPAGPGVLV
jgi:hypothetical protein